MNKIIRVFFDVDMRNGLDGLNRVATEHKLNLAELDQGEFVVFINSSKTILKLFATKDMYAHYRSPSGRIDTRMIQYIPTVFNGTRFKFDDALREALLKGGVKE